MKYNKEKRFDLPSFLWSVLTVAIIIIISFVAKSIVFRTKSSETYVGEISKLKYVSQEEACKAFLQNEISGISADVRFVDCISEGIIPKEDFNEYHFNIGNSEIYLSAEKIKIIYETHDGELKETYTYLFENDGAIYNYYTPAVPIGEQLNKSYFDSTFSSFKNTKNVTVDTKQTITFKIKGIPLNVSVNSIMEMSETVIHDYFYASGIGLGQGYDFYVFEDEKGIYAYTNMAITNNESGWVYISQEELGIESLEEYVMFGPVAYLDHTHFTKTTTGFEFNTSKTKSDKNAIIKQANKMIQEEFEDISKEVQDVGLREEFAKMYTYIENLLIESDLSLNMNFTVNNGLISKMTCRETFSFASIDLVEFIEKTLKEEIPEDEEIEEMLNFINSISLEITGAQNFRKHGATTIEIPESLSIVMSKN